MEEYIKFIGHDKKDSTRKAVKYYFKYHIDESLEHFIAKCRLQKDGVTIHYYPNMIVDMIKYQKYMEVREHKKKYENIEEQKGFFSTLKKIIWPK